jgi:thiol-disulfide isomerase/thioredoxin
MRFTAALLASAFSLAAQSPGLKLGDGMPAFALPGIDGKTFDSKAIQGPTVVVWLSTQCPVVRATEDRINALAKAYRGKVAFVGINSNESEKHQGEDLPGMKAHAAEKGYIFPYLRDEAQTVVRAFGALCTPDLFLFDGRGKLVYRGRLDDAATGGKGAPVTKEDLKLALEAVLAGRTPDPDQKPSRGCSIKWKD